MHCLYGGYNLHRFSDALGLVKILTFKVAKGFGKTKRLCKPSITFVTVCDKIIEVSSILLSIGN